MKNYIIKKGENKYTPFAGTKLISDMIDNLNIKDSLNTSFGLPKSNRGYTPYTYIKSVISGLLLGADCIMDIDNIKEDKALKEMLDIEIPHSTRIGSFLYSSNPSKIDLVHRIMQDVSVKAIKEANLDKVTLDADATFVKTDKDGISDYCYKNFKALSMLLGFIPEVGSCIYQEFRSGNTSPALNLDKQLISVSDYLSSKKIKLHNYRGDSASYQANIINYCELNKINYFVRARNNGADYSGLDFKPLHDKYGSPIDDMEIS